MKRGTIALLSLLSVLSAFPVSALDLRGQVIGIVDGDTLDMLELETRHIYRIRLNGINTPERGEPYYQKAKDSLASLAFGQSVLVDTMGQDGHGRTVGVIHVGNENVNLAQVQRGFAMVCKNYSRDKNLWEAEDQAVSWEINIWAPPGPRRPAWCKD